MSKEKEKNTIETYEKVFVQIESKEDEAKWKEFLKHYFPNHYASKLLDTDLVIDVVTRHSGHAYENKSLAVSTNGYGSISLRFAYWGGYKEVDNFEQFKLTACYKAILAQGVILDVGRPNLVVIKRW